MGFMLSINPLQGVIQQREEAGGGAGILYLLVLDPVTWNTLRMNG